MDKRRKPDSVNPSSFDEQKAWELIDEGKAEDFLKHLELEGKRIEDIALLRSVIEMHQMLSGSGKLKAPEGITEEVFRRLDEQSAPASVTPYKPLLSKQAAFVALVAFATAVAIIIFTSSGTAGNNGLAYDLFSRIPSFLPDPGVRIPNIYWLPMILPILILFFMTDQIISRFGRARNNFILG